MQFTHNIRVMCRYEIHTQSVVAMATMTKAIVIMLASKPAPILFHRIAGPPYRNTPVCKTSVLDVDNHPAML